MLLIRVPLDLRLNIPLGIHLRLEDHIKIALLFCDCLLKLKVKSLLLLLRILFVEFKHLDLVGQFDFLVLKLVLLRVHFVHDGDAHAGPLIVRQHTLRINHLDSHVHNELAAGVILRLQINRLLEGLTIRVVIGALANIELVVANDLLAAIELELQDGHLRLELPLVLIVIKARIHTQHVFDLGLCRRNIEGDGLGGKLALTTAPDAADFLRFLQLL
jgi:hypothetical protein